MSKELKALERIKDFMSKNAVHWKQDISMIETALKDYNNLLEKYDFKDIKELDDFLNKHRFIHQEQLDNKKKLKALEIIKDKGVDIKDLYKVLSFYLSHPDCELKEYIYYNSLKTEKERLTEQEYSLLKEVFLWD